MAKKWQVDLKEFEGLLNSNYDTAASLAHKGGDPQGACQVLVINGIAVGLLAIAERLEALVCLTVKLANPLSVVMETVEAVGEVKLGDLLPSRKCLCELDFREGKAPGPDHETTCPRYKEVKIGGTDPD